MNIENTNPEPVNVDIDEKSIAGIEVDIPAPPPEDDCDWSDDSGEFYGNSDRSQDEPAGINPEESEG